MISVVYACLDPSLSVALVAVKSLPVVNTRISECFAQTPGAASATRGRVPRRSTEFRDRIKIRRSITPLFCSWVRRVGGAEKRREPRDRVPGSVILGAIRCDAAQTRPSAERSPHDQRHGLEGTGRIIAVSNVCASPAISSTAARHLLALRDA